MADQQEGTGDTGNEPDLVAEEAFARRNGWAPKDQWRGPADQWMDVQDFNKKGREILPVVAASNRRLVKELEATKGALAQVKSLAEEQAKTVKSLVEHQESEIARQVDERIKELRADKRAALREGNHDLAADLEEQIDTQLDRKAELATKPPAPAPAPTPQQQEVADWAREFGEANEDWLGVDTRKTALFGAIADELMKTTALRAGPLLVEAKRQMEETLGGKPKRESKSEPGSGGFSGSGGGGRSGNGQSFSDLPQEAKDVCMRQASKFVGENGKAFKTQDAWKDHYAKTYFASQEKR